MEDSPKVNNRYSPTSVSMNGMVCKMDTFDTRTGLAQLSGKVIANQQTDGSYIFADGVLTNVAMSNYNTQYYDSYDLFTKLNFRAYPQIYDKDGLLVSEAAVRMESTLYGSFDITDSILDTDSYKGMRINGIVKNSELSATLAMLGENNTIEDSKITYDTDYQTGPNNIDMLIMENVTLKNVTMYLSGFQGTKTHTEIKCCLAENVTCNLMEVIREPQYNPDPNIDYRGISIKDVDVGYGTLQARYNSILKDISFDEDLEDEHPITDLYVTFTEIDGLVIGSAYFGLTIFCGGRIKDSIFKDGQLRHYGQHPYYEVDFLRFEGIVNITTQGVLYKLHDVKLKEFECTAEYRIYGKLILVDIDAPELEIAVTGYSTALILYSCTFDPEITKVTFTGKMALYSQYISEQTMTDLGLETTLNGTELSISGNYGSMEDDQISYGIPTGDLEDFVETKDGYNIGEILHVQEDGMYDKLFSTVVMNKGEDKTVTLAYEDILQGGNEEEDQAPCNETTP